MQLPDETAFNGQVRLPKVYALIGLGGMLLFLTICILAGIYLDKSLASKIVAQIVFAIPQAMGLVLIISYFNWRIDLYERTFVYRTIFRRQYEIAYADIVDIKYKSNTIHVYTPDKHLYIDGFSAGLIELFLKIYEDKQRMVAAGLLPAGKKLVFKDYRKPNQLDMDSLIRQKTKIVGQVVLPKLHLVIGVIAAILFGLPYPCSLLFPDSFTNYTVAVAVAFVAFQLAGVAMILMYFNCRIDLYTRTFIYQTIFRRKYQFAYADIIKIKVNANYIHVYTQNKHMYIDGSTEGAELFLKRYKLDKRRIEREGKAMRDKELKATANFGEKRNDR